MKYLIVLLIALLAGCSGFTQVGVEKELGNQRTERYNEYIKTKSDIVLAIAETLAKADRGGVKIDVDNDGRIKSFEVRERLDIDKLVEVAQLTPYREQRVSSGIEEFGDFVAKASNLGIVLAREHYNSKNTEEMYKSQTAISLSDNQKQTAMFESFSSNFDNSSITETSTSTSSSVIDSSNNVSDYQSEYMSETVNNSELIETETVESETIDSSNNTQTTEYLNPEI